MTYSKDINKRDHHRSLNQIIEELPMENVSTFVCFTLIFLVSFVHCYGGMNFKPMDQFIKAQMYKERSSIYSSSSLPVYIGPQDGLK